MTRIILRTVLTSMALVLMFAGSSNLNRIRAAALEAVAVVAGDCQTKAGCPGGPNLCGAIHYPDGTVVECGMS
jgi:hypothetical protein